MIYGRIIRHSSPPLKVSHSTPALRFGSARPSTCAAPSARSRLRGHGTDAPRSPHLYYIWLCIYIYIYTYIYTYIYIYIHNVQIYIYIYMVYYINIIYSKPSSHIYIYIYRHIYKYIYRYTSCLTSGLSSAAVMRTATVSLSRLQAVRLRLRRWPWGKQLKQLKLCWSCAEIVKYMYI